jgi:FKBP-type peptidyl-prolyl cis-trans isomerase FkpA
MTVARLAPVSLLALALALLACPAPEGPKGATTPTPSSSAGGDEASDAFYALGATLARYAQGMKLDPKDITAIQEGLGDALNNRPLRVDPREAGPKMQKILSERRSAAAAEEHAAGAEFLEKAAAAPGAVKTDSGLVYESLTEGTGASPKETDRVKVDYKGMLRDGTEFDSSISRGQPAVFNLNRVVPCWTEGLQKMKVGGKAKLTCPSELAYGERGVPGRIPPGAPLVFEVSLLEIMPEAEAPKVQAPHPAPKMAAPKPAPKAAPKQPAHE